MPTPSPPVMFMVFLVAAGVGGGVLVIQMLLALLGVAGFEPVDGHEGPDALHGAMTDGGGADAHHAHPGEGLSLVTLRGLAAALAGFGLAGLAFLRLGWSPGVAAGVAVGPAFALCVVAAWMTRGLLRLEHSGSLDFRRAVGLSATVYVRIPADGVTPGRVMLTLQGRTVEADAVVVAGDAAPLGPSAPVRVVGLDAQSRLIVAPADASLDP